MSDTQLSTLEHAFQIARLATAKTIEDIRRTLKAAQDRNVEHHTAGTSYQTAAAGGRDRGKARSPCERHMSLEERSWAEAGQFYRVHGETARTHIAEYLRSAEASGDRIGAERWKDVGSKLDKILRDADVP